MGSRTDWRRHSQPVIDSLIDGHPCSFLHLSERVSALPGAAHDRPLPSAMVRRRSGGVDQLHAVFPDSIAGRLCLCALAGIAAKLASAVLGAPGDARRILSVSADCAALGTMVIGQRGGSTRPNS